MRRRLFTGLLSVLGLAPQAQAAPTDVPAQPIQQQMSDLKETLSALAVQVGKESFSITLDYSEASIEKVEFILGELHKEYAKTKREDGIRGLAAEFAAYIIKVIEKHYEAGVWTRDHPSMGVGSFPYEWRGATIFPASWCFKRIVDGVGDDVSVKYRVFVVEHARATKAD